MTAFDTRTREYTVKLLALYSRPQTKIPEVAVVAPSRDGSEEMRSQGGACSNEDAKINNSHLAVCGVSSLYSIDDWAHNLH